MEVRLYRPEDKEEILKRIPSSNPETRKSHLQLAENCNMYSGYVSKDRSRINGFALIRDLGDQVSYYLYQITVRKNQRGKGIGTDLMNRIFEELGSGKHMSLCVNLDNKSAINFYESLGFKPSGFTKDYRKGQDKLWYSINF